MNILMKRLLAPLLAALLLAACAGQRAFDDGQSLIDDGQIEAGLKKLEQATKLEPDNHRFRQVYFRQRDVVLQQILMFAEEARSRGDWDAAEGAYRRMITIDPDNARARAALDSLAKERRDSVILAQAKELLKKGDTSGAQAKVREVLAQNPNHREAQQLLRHIEGAVYRNASAMPRLAEAMQRPIALQFREASLRQVFDAISQASGLNFIFDRDVRADTRTTLSVRNTSLDDVIRFVLVTNQLERKILSENTVLIYPNTQAKNRDYQDLVVRTFYLTNADAKTTANLIKTMVKTRDLHVDEKLNLIVMRDTPQAVHMAEQLVAAQDLADPEVMLEIEVLEVGNNVLRELGIRYPDQVSFGAIGTAGTPGTFTLNEWLNRSSNNVQINTSNPALALNLRNQISRANLLANPRIRVRSKEKAKIHIGDKVPVFTSTATATGLLSQSVTYLEVGLKLDVEPTVFLDDEVGIRIGLEVSNIVQQVTSPSGTLAYQIGTRNATTSLRLHDGETQMLAGLISDEDRKTANQIPGLGDLPILGRLFGSHLDSHNKNEIVLLITPHIVRNIVRPDPSVEQFASGTENAIGAPPLLLADAASATKGPITTNTTNTTNGSTAANPRAAINAPESGNAAGAATSPAAADTRVLLNAPANAQAGQEFTLQVSLESAAALRGGLLDIAFDPRQMKFVRAEPGALLTSVQPDAAFRVNAPEGLGRMTLGFSTKADINGTGELARLTFQALNTATGTAAVRVEALSLPMANGQLVTGPLPPSVSVTLKR